MTRILNAESDGYSQAARTVLEQLGEVHYADLDRAGLLATIGRHDVLIVRLRTIIDADVIAAAGPRLRTIVTATTGLDHIDLDEAARHDIAVLSLRGETEFLRTVSATAEHTWGLLLALVRNITPAAEAVRNGHWNRDEFKGHELRDKTLGIVGMGRIGTMVATYGQAFGMKVNGYDPSPETWPDHVTRVGSLTELAGSTDVLSIHVPLGPDTRHLIDHDILAALRPGAVIVNTSRGAIVDEAAAAALLETGHLQGIAADVVQDEHERSSPLLALATQRPDVIVTPHIAGVTHESMERTEVFMAHKLRNHLYDRETT